MVSAREGEPDILFYVRRLENEVRASCVVHEDTHHLVSDEVAGNVGVQCLKLQYLQKLHKE